MCGSAPKPPNPEKVSAAQTQSNKETAAYNAALNRVNQTNPFGSSTYTQNGTDPITGAPIYAQSTTLSPELQNLLDSQVGTQQGISSAITGTLGNLPTEQFNPNVNTNDIFQNSLNSQLAALKPQFEQGMTSLQGTLSDRGIPIGSEIWNTQLGNYNNAKDQSLLAASRQAQLDASNESQRQYGNQLQQYMLPYQQLSSLTGNSQSVSNPNFAGVPQSSSPATDVAGNIWNSYNTQLQNYQNQQNNLFGGLLGLGKLGLGAYSAGLFSDRRVKQDIKPVGKLENGLVVYKFRYKGHPEMHIGLMAQDVQKVHPEAVGSVGGVLTVDYDLATAA